MKNIAWAIYCNKSKKKGTSRVACCTYFTITICADEAFPSHLRDIFGAKEVQYKYILIYKVCSVGALPLAAFCTGKKWLSN